MKSLLFKKMPAFYRIGYNSFIFGYTPMVTLFGFFDLYTVACRKTGLFDREERRFLYFNHLSKEFPKQMIPHLKALI